MGIQSQYNRKLSNSYSEHDPININHDDDFVTNGFPGEGTKVSPYVISGLNISTSQQIDLISIKYTTKYFKIDNCLLDGVSIENRYGININDANNGEIVDNLIIGCSFGIYADNCVNLIIKRNNVVRCTKAYASNSLTNSIISENNATEIELGIDLSTSQNCSVTRNQVSNCNRAAIMVRSNSQNCTISSNTVQRGAIGIIGGWPVEGPIHLEISDWNYILGNKIIDSGSKNFRNGGLSLWRSSNNLVSRNVVSNQIGFGITITESSNYNKIEYNDFIDNSQGQVDELDSNSNNYQYNHWNDWNGSDIDQNFIGDTPYVFSGNIDSFPLTIPANDYLSPPKQPRILYPTSGENVSEDVVIQWLPSEEVNDLLNRKLTISYDVEYSDDGGTTWITIESNISFETTSFSWDTRFGVADGTSYRIRVIATNLLGNSSFGTSDIFTVQNHYITALLLEHPKGGETIKGVISIQWTEAHDSKGHTITYSIFYFDESTNNWTLIESGLTTNDSYSWDTRNVPDGSDYKLRIVAECPENEFAVIESGTFTIANGPPSFLPFFLFVGIVGAIGAAAFVLGTRRGRASIRGLFTAAGLRDKEIAEYAKKAKKVADDIEED